MREKDTKTMYISVGPVRDAVDFLSSGRLIGYYFMKKAWAEGRYTPYNEHFGRLLNRFEDLSFNIKRIVDRKIDKDTDLPMGPAPVGLAEVFIEFKWKENGHEKTALSEMAFQTITAEQFAADFQ
jgi:hypothetical protein